MEQPWEMTAFQLTRDSEHVEALSCLFRGTSRTTHLLRHLQSTPALFMGFRSTRPLPSSSTAAW